MSPTIAPFLSSVLPIFRFIFLPPTVPLTFEMSNVKVVSFIIKLLANKAGRNNIEKALQFGSRLLAAKLKASDPKNPWCAKLSHFSVFTSNGRKLGTLFDWLGITDQVRILT